MILKKNLPLIATLPLAQSLTVMLATLLTATTMNPQREPKSPTLLGGEREAMRRVDEVVARRGRDPSPQEEGLQTFREQEGA